MTAGHVELGYQLKRCPHNFISGPSLLQRPQPRVPLITVFIIFPAHIQPLSQAECVPPAQGELREPECSSGSPSIKPQGPLPRARAECALLSPHEHAHSDPQKEAGMSFDTIKKAFWKISSIIFLEKSCTVGSRSTRACLYILEITRSIP